MSPQHRENRGSPAPPLALTAGVVLVGILIVLAVLNALAGHWLVFTTVVVVIAGLAWDVWMVVNGWLRG